MIPRFIIKTISANNLIDFFSNDYKPNFDLPKIDTIFNDTLELYFDQDYVPSTNILHTCFDKKENKYCAILNIGTTTSARIVVQENTRSRIWDIL